MVGALEILAWLAALGVGAAVAATLWLGLDGVLLHATVERCQRCGRLGWAHDGPPHPDGCPAPHPHGPHRWAAHRRER